MKTAFSYVTLRYVHDVVTGEFVNVGVVVYAPDQHFLQARFVKRCDRLKAMFVEIDEPHLRALIEHLSIAFEELSRGSPLQAKTIGELVRRVLPADDSSLQWSKASGGFTENPTETAHYLFSRLVERYARPPSISSSDFR
jgi:DUF3037 family protein